MRSNWTARCAWIIALALVSCAPAAPPPAGSRSEPAAVGEPAASQTLVAAVRYEPVSLASKPLRATGSTVDFTVRLFNAELALTDARGTARPYLAEALPQLNTPTWSVSPDGTMATIYRLRPDVVWHDGAALGASDFVFAWQVYSWVDLGLSGSKPQNLIDEVSAPDERTVSIRWRALYPEAGVLGSPLFQPLPRHVLEATMRQGDTDAFVNHPYWGAQYLGSGPYRLERWEPGALIEATAFERHVLGRPKIGRVVVRFFTDENTALANVLSANVHLAMDRALRYEHVTPLRQDWGSSGKGEVILTPTQWRYQWSQTRPSLAEPRGLLDLRVRQALAHTVDKSGLNDLFGGEGAMADTLLPRSVPYFADLDKAIMKYPQDPRRAEQLMSEAGYAKGSDGIYLNSGGERMSFEYRGDSGSQFEKDLAVVADGWHRAGFDPKLYVIPAAQFRDIQFRTNFKGIYSTTSGAAQDTRLENFTSTSIPTAENRWSGSNYAGWSNQEFDRLWADFSNTLDQPTRNNLAIQMMRVVSEDVVLVPLFHNFEVAAYFQALKGPDKSPVAFSMISWNLHEWELR